MQTTKLPEEHYYLGNGQEIPSPRAVRIGDDETAYATGSGGVNTTKGTFMTQTTNTQIDRIIKRTDEITEKELARQELPNPRTQTNTTQNKEELITPEMKKKLGEMFPQISRTYSHYDVEMALEAVIPLAHQSGIEEEPEKMIVLSNGKKVSESTVIEALRALTN